MLRRAVLSTLAAAAVVVGLTVLSAVIVVRAVVLQPATYTSALVETEAYERVYTEALADPELAGLKDALLGGLGVPDPLKPQFRTLGVNVARWLVPPSTLRRLSETVIDRTLAYVRGDVPRLDVDVKVDAIVARIPTTTVREVRALLASAAERSVSSTEELSAAVRDLADQLAAGQVPARVPKLGGLTFDAEEVATAILDGLGDRVDAATRERVLATVLAGDQRNAVIDAAALAVTEHARSVADRLADEPTIDVTALIADNAGRPVASVVDSLDAVRDLARWASPWVGAAGLALAAAGAFALRRLVGGGRPWAAWFGGALVAAGLAVLAGWLVVRGAVESPLTTATSPGPDGWRLPPGTSAIVADVARDVGDRIGSVATRTAGVLVLLGVAVAAAGLVATLVRAVTVRRVAVVATVAVAVVAFSALVAGRPDRDRACNGHTELCDRAYDDVVYAATHNSMSAPDVVRIWPEHDGSLTAQLDAGVRTLLIDTHEWPAVTSARQLVDAARTFEPVLPAALVEALYENVVAVRDGRPGEFLCHNHCLFGAQPLVEGLSEVTAFLDANPHEVVTLIIQDAISPAQTAAAFDAADLTRHTFTHGDDEPWPTLGEMIERDERLVVFAEEAGPPPDWYANAFDAMQETPFLFLSADDFSCAENRGDPDATLFLMNHWVQRIAPDRADSVEVNRLDVLVDRARQCADERGLMPNYLAVNFYDIGDVVEATDVLNGVDGIDVD